MNFVSGEKTLNVQMTLVGKLVAIYEGRPLLRPYGIVLDGTQLPATMMSFWCKVGDVDAPLELGANVSLQ